jgi:hypothetical protein
VQKTPIKAKNMAKNPRADAVRHYFVILDEAKNPRSFDLPG